MQILVISGFLGAGKTTFIKEMLRHTAKEIAILENEVGELGVDGDALKKETEDSKINIWELTEGCICCSTKGDFANNILTIANTINPEVLIVEPTGVGMLSNIITNIKQVEYERIGLLAPITIVDGLSYLRYEKEFPVMYNDQVGYGRTIVVSKMENADEDELKRIEDFLKEKNPEGEIVTEHYSKKDDEWWDRLLSTTYDGQDIRKEAADYEGLETFSIPDAKVKSPVYLINTLENLIRGQFGNIIRAKGYIKFEDKGLRFDVADSRYSILLTDEVEDGKAVFIGTDINRYKLRKYLFARSDSINFLTR